MLDQAFETLKNFDLGTPLTDVAAIEDAVVAGHKDPAICKDLEQRLIAALSTGLSRVAKDYVCRKLAICGSAAAVPALAVLLLTEENSHLARHALERIPGHEASVALAAALPKLSGKLKLGVIASIGTRKEPTAIAALGALLNDADAAVVRAAALSLGVIGGPGAVAALRSTLTAAKGSQPLLIDALLSCAESMLATSQMGDAAAIYQSLDTESQPRIVRLAATRGLLACAST